MADSVGKDVGHFFGIPADVPEPEGMESTWTPEGYTPDYMPYAQDLGTSQAEFYANLQRALAARQAQEGLVGQLQAQARGEGPSIAQLMYEQRRQEALKDQASLASSARGMRSATSQRALTEQASESQRKAVLEAAMLRLQEQMNAQKMLGESAGQMRGQDYQGAGMAGQMYGTQSQALNAQNQGKLNFEELKQKDAAQRAQAALERYRLAVAQEQARAQAWGNLGKSLLGAGGDTGGFLQNMMKNKQPTDTPTEKDTGGDGSLGGMTGGDTGADYGNPDYGGEAQTTESTTTDSGSDGSWYPTNQVESDSGDGDGSWYANGGYVQRLKKMASGGVVPGKPVAKGNSPRNDKVPAMARPGEVVLPRTVANGEDAPDKAHAFVQALKCGGSVKGMADGGSVVDDEAPGPGDYGLDGMPETLPESEMDEATDSGGRFAIDGVDEYTDYDITQQHVGPYGTGGLMTTGKTYYGGTDPIMQRAAALANANPAYATSARDRADYERWKAAYERSSGLADSIEARNFREASLRYAEAQKRANRLGTYTDEMAAAEQAYSKYDPEASLRQMQMYEKYLQNLRNEQNKTERFARAGAYEGHPGESQFTPDDLQNTKTLQDRAYTVAQARRDALEKRLAAAKEEDAQRTTNWAKDRMAESQAAADEANRANMQRISRQAGIAMPSQARMDTSAVPSAQLDEATKAKIAQQNAANAGVQAAPVNSQQAALNEAEKKRSQGMAQGGIVTSTTLTDTELGDQNVPAPSGQPGMLTQTSSATAPDVAGAGQATNALALGDQNVFAARASLRGALGYAEGGEVDPSTGVPQTDWAAVEREDEARRMQGLNRTSGFEREAEMNEITRRQAAVDARHRDEAVAAWNTKLRQQAADEMERKYPEQRVPVMLSPGEIVVDPKTAQSPDKTAEFVSAIKSQRRPQEYSGVLMAERRAQEAARQAAPPDEQPSEDAAAFVQRMASPDGRTEMPAQPDQRAAGAESFEAVLSSKPDTATATNAARDWMREEYQQGRSMPNLAVQRLAAQYGYDSSFVDGMPILFKTVPKKAAPMRNKSRR